MKYFSTRNNKLELGFKEIFLKGLAPDGGLFLPNKIKKYESSELNKLCNLSYNELATEIISNFCDEDLSKNNLQKLIVRSYKNFSTKNVVEIKKIGSTHLLELYKGPTLAFKDIAMQVIGQMYEEFKLAHNKQINIVVATSGDTGSAAISALKNRENINVFVLHPHKKISRIQRQIMTTIDSKNIYNLAIEGTFDDCQKILKDMFSDENFRDKINMSGVNSINWARIVCQIVYYFYAFFKFNKDEVNFSVPTGNFGDVYAGYIAKQMGLKINKLIVATNENDILQRVINYGEYKPSKVKKSLSPSMDIQVASNFERLLYDLVDKDDQKVKVLMEKLKTNGAFNLQSSEIEKMKKDFFAVKISDNETLNIIKEFNEKYNFTLDPHTATAIGASKKINKESSTIILGTAHPYKFLETIKLATGKDIDPPNDFSAMSNSKEKFDIVKNELNEVKNYIIERI